MEQLTLPVASIREDVDAIRSELNQQFSSKGWTNLVSVAEQAQYWNKISSIKDIIDKIIKMLLERLSDFEIPSEFVRGLPVPFPVMDKIAVIQNLMTQLTDTWDRLGSFLLLIEQRQRAAPAAPAAPEAAEAPTAPAQPISPLLSWYNILKNWIINAAGQVWNLICGLMTPKEWKIGGTLSSGPFGLPSANIEITFGP